MPMSEILVFLTLVGLVLAFVSYLLYISLAARGISPTRVYRLLIELWATFILIITIFIFITQALGPVPEGSLAAELAARLARWGEMQVWQQGVIIIGALLAILLFIHVILSLRAAQSKPIE